MSGKVLFGFLVCFVMCHNSNSTLAFELNKNDLSDILTALLGHSRWTKLNSVKVKHLDSTNHNPFSGKDLFINRGLFSGTKHIGNSRASAENVYNKYYMVTSLLACVYAKVIDDFVTLIKTLLDVSRNERESSRSRISMARRNMKLRLVFQQSRRLKVQLQNDQSHKENSDDSDDDMRTSSVVDEENQQNGIDAENKIREKSWHDEELSSYKNSWKVFNFTCQQLLNSQQVFNYMYASLFYLLSFVSPEEYYLHCNTEYLQKILLLVQWFKDASNNLKEMFQADIIGDAVDYMSKVGKFSKKLLTSINTRLRHYWKPFVGKICILPKKDNVPLKQILQNFRKEFPFQEKTDIMYQFEKQIQELFKEFISKYYLDLGFVF